MFASKIARRLRQILRGTTDPAVGALAQSPPPPAGKVVFPGSDGGPFEPLRALIAAYDSRMPPHTLFFGDSVYLRVADEDSDPRPMYRMIEEAMAERGRGLVIAHSAFNLRIYDALHAVLDTVSARPKQLVVPINMRSFSPQWFENPAWQLADQGSLIAARTADPFAPVGPVNDLRQTSGFYDSYEATPVSYELSPFTTIRAFRQVIADEPTDDNGRLSRLRTIMVFHYTHPLAADHPLLSHLEALVNRAGAALTTVLPVLLPLNMRLGEEVVGPDFRRIVRANTQIVVDRCTALGTPALDLSDAFPSDHFFHLGSPTEHLRDHGRIALVARILDALGN